MRKISIILRKERDEDECFPLTQIGLKLNFREGN